MQWLEILFGLAVLLLMELIYTGGWIAGVALGVWCSVLQFRQHTVSIFRVMAFFNLLFLIGSSLFILVCAIRNGWFVGNMNGAYILAGCFNAGAGLLVVMFSDLTDVPKGGSFRKRIFIGVPICLVFYVSAIFLAQHPWD